MKISYHASLKKVSLLEYFIVTLIKSYHELRIKDLSCLEMEENKKQEDESPPERDVSDLVVSKIRGLAALGTCFSSNLRGLARL